ncbi:pseudouridine synthase, partial [Dendrothele bispora CBS 962.96]
LSQQFQTRTVSKIYYALVRKGIDSFGGSTQGSIKTCIAYKNGYGHLSETGQGKEAITEWALVGSSSNVPLSLVRLNLLTGNKHQLRIHLAAALGAPILGDQRYSQTVPIEPLRRLLPTSKSSEAPLFLHASHLSFFRYRKNGGKKRFRLGIQAPLPEQFLQLCLKAGIKFDPELAQGGVFIDNKPVEDGRVPELDGQYLHIS